jgi:hypothetical protein
VSKFVSFTRPLDYASKSERDMWLYSLQAIEKNGPLLILSGIIEQCGDFASQELQSETSPYMIMLHVLVC